MLSNEDDGKRWHAVESVGRMRDPGAVEPLIDKLRDDNFRVRLKAARALGQIGDIRATGPLRRLFRMENDEAHEIITGAIKEFNLQMDQQ